MSREQPPRAVLDSDIIFSRVLHELMGRIAQRLRLIDLVWSAELLDEAKLALIERKGLGDDVARRWVDYLPRSFPAGRVDIAEALASGDLGSMTRDPGDHHVCALAIASGADYLLTHDRGYLRDALQIRGVAVTSPDLFLVDAFREHANAIIDVLELQASTWAGGRPIEELLDALDRAGASEFARVARGLLDV